MKLYIEGVERLPETATDQTPDFVRIEMDTFAGTEQDAVAAIKSLLAGKKFVVRRHFCYHDERPTKPCKVEVIEEVGNA